MTNGGRASMANVVLFDAWSKSLLGAARRVHRHGEGDDEGDDLGEDDQLEVDGERLGDDGRRRLVRRVGLAQVALEDVADPDEVLLPQRLVEAQLAVDRGDVLRRGVGPEDGVGGVAREQVDQEERRRSTRR